MTLKIGSYFKGQVSTSASKSENYSSYPMYDLLLWPCYQIILTEFAGNKAITEQSIDFMYDHLNRRKLFGFFYTISFIGRLYIIDIKYLSITSNVFHLI